MCVNMFISTIHYCWLKYLLAQYLAKFFKLFCVEINQHISTEKRVPARVPALAIGIRPTIIFPVARQQRSRTVLVAGRWARN